MEFGDSGFWCLWEMTREKLAIRDTKKKKIGEKSSLKNELVSENFKVYILSSIQD